MPEEAEEAKAAGCHITCSLPLSLIIDILFFCPGTGLAQVRSVRNLNHKAKGVISVQGS